MSRLKGFSQRPCGKNLIGLSNLWTKIGNFEQDMLCGTPTHERPGHAQAELSFLYQTFNKAASDLLGYAGRTLHGSVRKGVMRALETWLCRLSRRNAGFDDGRGPKSQEVAWPKYPDMHGSYVL